MATRPSYAAMAQHASYEHERLKLSDRSIRLFQIQRGSKDEPISLRMTQFSAQRRPKYKAVSYTWGSSNNPKQLLVNGKAFSMHTNLWHLLYHLRLKKETAFLWADALCINQLNLRERNFHVQLMGTIYQKAESVIVWLGLPSPDRTEIRAMDFIKEIAAYRKVHSDTRFIDAYLRSELQHRWQTLLRMCRPSDPAAYWNRTWVIQEFLFAPVVEVLAGNDSLEWKAFEDLVDVLKASPLAMQHPVIPQILRSRTTRLTLRRKADSQSSLHELLLEYSDSACTERRDKVYGILGLAADCSEDPQNGQARGVKPDYEKDIVEVFLEALDCVKISLPSCTMVPAATLLILQALHIEHEDLADYILKRQSVALPCVQPQQRLYIQPEYISPVLKVWEPWTSIRDLQQKLESYDYGQHIGYEIQKVPSGSKLMPSKNTKARRLSARMIHSSLPANFIPNVVEAADLCTITSTLHNYPCEHELVLAHEHITFHAHDKAAFENPNFHKPRAILDQASNSETLRLGFACTSTQRGDFIVQFGGMDITLIVRQVQHEYKLVGKAMMIEHSGIEYAHPINPICAANQWSSHCWHERNPEQLQFETDPLSLAELLLT